MSGLQEEALHGGIKVPQRRGIIPDTRHFIVFSLFYISLYIHRGFQFYQLGWFYHLSVHRIKKLYYHPKGYGVSGVPDTHLDLGDMFYNF
jgi:hypothetical protein